MKFSQFKLIGYGIGMLLKQLPSTTRAKVLEKIIQLSAEQNSPEKTLKFLFELENSLYKLEGQLSVEYGNGIHTKHRHINYHDLFIKNIQPGERVLDIGSGNGLMSYDLVTSVQDVQVVGIELNEENIKYAQNHYKHPNLKFIHGDALKDIPSEHFDVVTLSNVLEHVEKRIEFLKTILKKSKPKRLIIRVPTFERDWRVPLKKELGVDYRLDPTHYIEYTKEEFLEEINNVGLEIIDIAYRWGEIWSVVYPIK